LYTETVRIGNAHRHDSTADRYFGERQADDSAAESPESRRDQGWRLQPTEAEEINNHARAIPFQQICDRLDEPFRTMVVIAMCLGLRVSEILALKWSDFDFEEGTLMITRGTVHARIGRVKTEYSEDEMPLHLAFAEILLSWQAMCPASEEGWVFPNPNTRGVWHASVLQGDILVPIGKEVGIERLGWHTFRHSYRSMLDACGAPIGVQQKLMRHAQVSTTMKYGNAYMTEKRKAHGAVVEMVLPVQTNEKAEARSASA
jgi:integrase